VALLVVVGSFVFPFAALLSRTLKRQARALLIVAAALVAVRLVDVFWLVAPVFAAGLRVHWLDVLAPLALGGLWVGLFVHHLRTGPPPAPATAGGAGHG
jgi:hypothetical protein